MAIAKCPAKCKQGSNGDFYQITQAYKLNQITGRQVKMGKRAVICYRCKGFGTVNYETIGDISNIIKATTEKRTDT